MPVTNFPDPRQAPPDGLLAVGGNLAPETLVQAYSMGIFPWPISLSEEEARQTGRDTLLAWFSPNPRAILDFSALHIPKSLARALRKAIREDDLRFSVDEAFEKVIRACSEVPRPGQPGTWISPEMLKAYLRFHELGYAHSVEVWQREELVGGMYGVEVKGVFAGESMFHRTPNASKFALLHLIEILKTSGLTWIDIQMLTPHMKALGAREIGRNEFLNMLSETQALGLKLFQG